MTREIINKLGDYCYKYGKDFAQTFDEWLDWMIDFFCLENVLEHDCDFTKITDEMRESNEVFFLCRSTGKLCSRATEYGSCRSTASSDYICSLYAIEDGTLKSNLGEGL